MLYNFHFSFMLSVLFPIQESKRKQSPDGTKLKGTPSRSEQEDTKGIPPDWRSKMPKSHPRGEGNGVSKVEGSRGKWD